MKIKKKIKYLFFCFVFLLLGLYFSRNIIFAYLFEAGAEAIFGAKAEVKKCNLHIFSGKLSWENFAVADKNKPMKNLFQTGYVELDFGLSALLKGQFVCENILVDKLEFGTNRATDGRLPQKADKGEKSAFANFAVNYLENKKKSIPVLEYQSLNVDSILNTAKFITPLKADSLRKEIENANEFWTNVLVDKKYKQRINEIKQKFDDLDLSNPDIDIKELGVLYRESSALYKEIKENKAEFEKQIALLKTANNLKNWAKQDYDNAMKMVKFPDTQGKQIGELLFGDIVYSLILKGVTAIKTVRTASSAEKKKEEQRLRFWLKEAQINSKLNNGINIKGEIKNISNAQKLTGKPVTASFMLSSEKIESIKVAGELNYLNNESKDSFLIEMKGVRFGNIKLNQEVLPPKIESGSLSGWTSFQIVGEDIIFDNSTTISDILYSYEYEKPVSSQMKEIAKIVGSSAHPVWIKVNCEFTPSQNVNKITSNLDEIVKNALYKKFSKESKKLEEKIRKKIGLQKEQKELSSLFEKLDKNVQSTLFVSDPISAEAKEKKEKEINDNLIKKGKEIINNDEIKNKAKDIIKGIKF